MCTAFHNYWINKFSSVLCRINPPDLDPSLMWRTRYFVIKSNSTRHVMLSIQHGVWCSTLAGNDCLNRAYLSMQQPALAPSTSTSTSQFADVSSFLHHTFQFFNHFKYLKNSNRFATYPIIFSKLQMVLPQLTHYHHQPWTLVVEVKFRRTLEQVASSSSFQWIRRAVFVVWPRWSVLLTRWSSWTFGRTVGGEEPSRSDGSMPRWGFCYSHSFCKCTRWKSRIYEFVKLNLGARKLTPSTLAVFNLCFEPGLGMDVGVYIAFPDQNPRIIPNLLN